MPRTSKPVSLALAAILAVLFAAPANPQAKPREFVVTMDAMSYGGVPTDAKVGDVIVWDNRDTAQHTATARDSSFDVRLQPGKRARTVLKKAGTLAIYCIYHPMMRTTMKVAAS